MYIFNNYGKDIEYVRETYEKYKESPPLSRNTPPIAGSIAWARQLLRKIEGPMQFFETTAVMQSKDAKKVIKTYNRVATALIGFETLFYDAWCKSVDAAKDGLHATILVRHPETRKIFVNFDSQILQLLREIRCLDRMSLRIPDAAQAVYNQEEKFKVCSE